MSQYNKLYTAQDNAVVLPGLIFWLPDPELSAKIFVLQ